VPGFILFNAKPIATSMTRHAGIVSFGHCPAMKSNKPAETMIAS
jgi:hypothetical protein